MTNDEDGEVGPRLLCGALCVGIVLVFGGVMMRRRFFGDGMKLMMGIGLVVLAAGVVGCGRAANKYRDAEVVTPGGTYTVKVGVADTHDAAGNPLPPTKYRTVEKVITTPAGQQTVVIQEEVP